MENEKLTKKFNESIMSDLNAIRKLKRKGDTRTKTFIESHFMGQIDLGQELGIITPVQYAKLLRIIVKI